MEQNGDDLIITREEFQQTCQYYFGKISGAGRLIYNSVLVFSCAVIASLFFIRVNVSVKASGIIRPVSEKTIISSLITGQVDKIHCREGDPVEKGQVLITLDQGRLLNELDYRLQEEMLIKGEISDLVNLLANKDKQMVSVKYKLEYDNFINQTDKVNQQLDKARREKERYANLYKEKYISDKEYDDLLYAESLLTGDLNYLVSSTMSRWQNELSRLQYQFNQTATEITRIKRELRNCEIIAPVSGQIDQLSGIYDGSNIQAGQQLASVTPDTLLIGEIYITPDNIGLIRKGQEAILIIDAFNYREWGTLQGVITDIPDDIMVINGQPVFRIKCKPEQEFLNLRNGFRGRLKKGMTFQACCITGRRSLAQLLITRIDHWFNPSITSKIQD